MKDIGSLPRSLSCAVLIGVFCAFSIVLALPSPASAMSAADVFTIRDTAVSKVKHKLSEVDLSEVRQDVKQNLSTFSSSLEDSVARAEQIAVDQAESFQEQFGDFGIDEYIKKFNPRDQLERLKILEKFHQITVPQYLRTILSNRLLIKDINTLMGATPKSFCAAYYDMKNDVDDARWVAIQKSAGSIFAIANAMTSASFAGAGSLSGYAGIAAVVSHMGLGSVTTTLAGLLGANVSGAAATAVVTSTVGGPLIMGVILAGGTGGAAYATYKLGHFTTKKLDRWAEGYCGSIGLEL